jgi:hypothetical protein
VFMLGRRELLSVLGTYPAAMLPLVTLMCGRTRVPPAVGGTPAWSLRGQGRG